MYEHTCSHVRELQRRTEPLHLAVTLRFRALLLRQTGLFRPEGLAVPATQDNESEVERVSE